MLKPLLFILVIVILAAVTLNLDLLVQPVKENSSIIKSVEKIEVKILPKAINTPTPLAKKVIIENDLKKELEELLSQAKRLFNENKDAEALLLYEKIIQKSQESQDVKILKLFAKACFEKATIHYIFPSYDVNSALESYELIIKKFENSENKELLLLYMKAKIQQAPFSSKEEILLTYDELIEKFTNDKEKRFDKEIEDLLFAKSFALMGIDNEEAIDVLDSIIAKYADKSILPNTVRLSILNNIELSIITGNETEKYVDLATQYMFDSPNTKPLLEMLNIIKNAQNLDQTEAMEIWRNEYGNYNFPDWDFSELRKWVNKMEIPESQIRISSYLDAFEKQKYNNAYQPTNNIQPIPEAYSDSATQNEYSDPSTQEEEATAVYEPNPYQNDIINSEAEISYPNPYSNYEPNIEANGVSHTYNPSDY